MSGSLDQSFVRAIIRNCEHTLATALAQCLMTDGGVEDRAWSKTAILARGT